MVSWVVYTIVNGLRMWHQQRMLGQFQTKLLERIGSVNELGAFLNTEAGSRFLKELTTVNEAPLARTCGFCVRFNPALSLARWAPGSTCTDG